jgi:protein ImuB
MTRVVSLFLPTLSTDRVRRKLADEAPPPDTPLVLVGRDGSRRVVMAADAAAQAAGLRVSMSATKAQALVPRLVMLDADPTGDAAARAVSSPQSCRGESQPAGPREGTRRESRRP